MSSLVKDGIVTPLAAIADFGTGQALTVMNADNEAQEQTLRTQSIDGPIIRDALIEVLREHGQLP